jgi:formylglycine-generating enzyme required for sulfatase activity
MILLFLVLFVILIGAGLLVWNQMEKQRAQEREFMEAQKQQLEEQRKGIENAQKELLTQLSDAKRAVDEKKKVAELQKTAEPEPEAKPVAKPEPFEEEKKVAEIETQLAKLRDQARVTARKTAEIEVAMPPPPKEDRSAKLEAERRRAEDKKAAAEARKLEQERKREEAKKAREEAVQKAAEEKKAKEEAAKKAEEERLAAEAARGPECPKGMILIPAGAFKFGSSPNDPMKGMGEKNNETVNLSVYCIDIFEFPNKSGKQPAVNVSFNAAEASCKKAGKRLCTEAEWEKACKGPGGLRYPYGNSWEADACNQADEAGNKKSVAVAGASTKCKSGYGAADMSGNAAEWVETGGGNKALKGGGADKPNFAVRCAARVSADPGKTGPTFGFRCCAEPE